MRKSNRRLQAAVAGWLGQALLPLAGAVLAFATLALGGTTVWARAAVPLAVLALLGAWLLAGALRGELEFTLPALLFPLLGIFLLACLQAFARLSVYPPATRREVWELVAVGGLFFLLSQQLAARGRLQGFATGLVLFAAALAVFAVLQGLSYEGRIYWSWPAPPGSSPYGPFINRNHYAAWALMVLPLAWVQFSERRRRDLQALWALVVVVLGVSVLLSQSRAGLALFLLAFPLYWWLGRRPRRSQRSALALGFALILLAAAATLAIDSGEVTSRWGTLGQLFIRPEAVDTHRWQIWRDTLPMVRDHLWLGSGLETYGALSNSYRSFYSSRRWLQAHNDYLQWLAETGLVGGALGVWFFVVLARSGAEKLGQLGKGPERRLTAGALAGCLLGLLHSLVDFPLRIPANALLFAALLAMIAAATPRELDLGQSPAAKALQPEGPRP